MLSTVRARRAGFIVLALVLLTGILLSIGGGGAPSTAAAASGPVSVFPIPGGQVVSPQSQIAFRGIPAGQIGTVTVTGSRSGAHTGHVAADSDGQGGSFLPDRPFTAGETVTVQTGLNVAGAHNGGFTFHVATPAGAIPNAPLPPAKRVRNDVASFRSRPDLSPATVSIDRRSGATAPGDIFLAPQQGPLQNGPMIIAPTGQLVWFKKLAPRMLATDLRVQRYQGNAVLTWWQGTMGAGVGVGEDVVNDTSYRQIAVVHAANGLNADLHEFDISPRGTALITAYYPVYANASSVHGLKRQIVLDSVVQEIDIPTGLVLFQWDSLDHVPLTSSYAPAPKSAGAPYDYFHVNAIEPDRDGNIVISSRNTWAAYKVDHATGRILWTLGGKHSSFKMGPGASFAFQHDVRVRSNGDLFITVFDDGAGPPSVHANSRGLKLILDFKHMTARWVAGLDHVPNVLANFEGNYQQLTGGDDFLGWGQQPYFTEFNSHGKVIFDGHFVGANSNYRAYRFPWTAQPDVPPAVTATTGNNATAYVSWNGATTVSSWRILGGADPSKLAVVANGAKRNFETAIKIPPETYVQAQALDGHGNVLGTTPTVRAR